MCGSSYFKLIGHSSVTVYLFKHGFTVLLFTLRLWSDDIWASNLPTGRRRQKRDVLDCSVTAQIRTAEAL